MNLAKAIRDRRRKLGLQDVAVAKSSGLSIHEYGDIEQHADEFETAISTGTARQVCHVLGLELRSLLGLPKVTSKEMRDISELIRNAREAQKLSQLQVADRIGFNEDTIRSLESTPAFVDTLPLKVLYELEDALGLERGSLIQERRAK